MTHGIPFRRALVCGALLAVVVSVDAVPALAQAGPKMDRERMERRVRQRMAEVIQERLGLDPERAAALEGVMGEARDRRRELARAEEDLRQELRAYVEEDEGDGQAALSILDRMTALRLEEARLFEEEQEALLELLEPREVVLLHELRLRMMERIRELRSQGPEHRDRGPPGPSRRE